MSTPEDVDVSKMTKRESKIVIKKKTTQQKEDEKIERNEIPICEVFDRTDFSIVMEGYCYLNLKVKITFDQSDALQIVK